MKQAHIQLEENLGVKYAILPGDPGRINKIIPFFDSYEEVMYNREYRSVVGTYKGVKILAMSTGMGGVSTSIAVEELHNIGIEYAIRIGSCGTSQKEVKMGDLIIPCGVVRDDGTTHCYTFDTYPAVPDLGLLNAIVESAKEAQVPHHVGISRSHESFYAEDEAQRTEYWANKGILGEDMESAPLMVVGRLVGLKAASILNNVVESEGDTADSIASYQGGESLSAIGEKNEIKVALDAFIKIDK
ncbi:MAG: nucleoside phosphorylase [Clostridia bacterium]|nr:nucleoside phosphorylase [Clostridia bacterium]